MPRSPFVAFILLLAFTWMQVYDVARRTYGAEARAVTEAKLARRRVIELTQARALDRERLIEFQQNVATLMPDAVKTLGLGREGYPVRALASVVAPAQLDDATRGLIARTLFESGKKAFEAKDYAKANKVFGDVIKRYSFTSYAPESYFLLAEGLYQQNELEQSVITINHMIELFPADELTGFAMIRLGRISQERNHNDQAVEIFKTVMRTFPQRDVAAQAKESLRGVEL